MGRVVSDGAFKWGEEDLRRTCFELSLGTERRVWSTLRCSSGDVDGEVVIPEVKAEASPKVYLSETEACSCCLDLPWKLGTVIYSRCGEERGKRTMAMAVFLEVR